MLRQEEYFSYYYYYYPNTLITQRLKTKTKELYHRHEQVITQHTNQYYFTITITLPQHILIWLHTSKKQILTKSLPRARARVNINSRHFICAHYAQYREESSRLYKPAYYLIAIIILPQHILINNKEKTPLKAESN